ncbi:MAG TPA: hypothetical protein DEP99_03990 [Nitrospiraceae bacterium]|nr:hypothetical protein [Nitrospiraceae bacterium]
MWVVVEKVIDFVSQKVKNFLLFRPSIKLSVEGYSQYYDKELKAIRIMILLGLTLMQTVFCYFHSIYSLAKLN